MPRLIAYKPFTSQLQTWNGVKNYNAQKRELAKQIRHLINIQSGLGQSNQGHPEDPNVRLMWHEEAEALKNSIKAALLIT